MNLKKMLDTLSMPLRLIRETMPAPDLLQVRWMAVLLMILALLQAFRVLVAEGRTVEAVRPAKSCSRPIQIGSIDGWVACADRGFSSLKQAGLDPCCLRKVRLESLHGGDRLLCRREGSKRCRLQKLRMAAETLAALDIPIDLNSGSEDELKSLPGVGATLARRIVAFREKNGPFASVEGLLLVKGFGPVKLERVRHRLTIR